MTDKELHDRLDNAFLPYVARPEIRSVLVGHAARIAQEHAASSPVADVPSPTATNPRE